MNFLTKISMVIFVIVIFYSCDNKAEQALAPPENARHVSVSFKVPDGIILMPMQVLYRSEKCMTKSHNSNFESYPVPGYNSFSQPLIQKKNSNIWLTNIAIEGGGSCQWNLNSLMVSFKIADSNPLVQGKEVIETSYIFDFDDYGLSDGYGTGKAYEVSGDLTLKTEFFPEVFISHLFKKKTLELFGGDTRKEKFSRRYKLNTTQNIIIEPLVHLDKIVTLEGPNPAPGEIIASYPNGSREPAKDNRPDYIKLLSMK